MNSVVKYWLILVILFTPLCVEAAPYSHVKTSDDKKFLFVMITPIDPTLGKRCCTTPGQIEERRLRETYPSSGMYLNDGSTTPLWTVDWWARDVIVPSDGEHVISFGKPHEMTGEALTFFRRNEVLRSYTLGELAEKKQLIPGPSGEHIWLNKTWLKRTKSHLVVETVDVSKVLGMPKKNFRGHRYDFDYTTGEMVFNGRMLDTIGWTVVISFVIGFLLLVLYAFCAPPVKARARLYKKRRKKRRKRRSNLQNTIT